MLFYITAVPLVISLCYSITVEDWDVFEQVVDYTYAKHLRSVPSEHPVLMSEASVSIIIIMMMIIIIIIITIISVVCVLILTMRVIISSLVHN